MAFCWGMWDLRVGVCRYLRGVGDDGEREWWRVESGEWAMMYGVHSTLKFYSLFLGCVS